MHHVEEHTPALVLGPRFADAVGWASHLHRDQSRKDSTIPYVSHLLGAASLLLEQEGADEDEAIAALLHDVIEDSEETDLAEIRRRFGDKVATIVADCTDADTIPKPPWRHRKAAFLAHLETVAPPSLRVSLADKLHNATATAEDLAREGDRHWARFNAPPVAQRWYYRSLAELYLRRLGNPLSQRMARTVAALTDGLPDAVELADLDARPRWVDVGQVTGAATSIDDVDTSGWDAGGWVLVEPEVAWVSGDGAWWVERADAGDPQRPLTVFVAPPAGHPGRGPAPP